MCFIPVFFPNIFLACLLIFFPICLQSHYAQISYNYVTFTSFKKIQLMGVNHHHASLELSGTSDFTKSGSIASYVRQVKTLRGTRGSCLTVSGICAPQDPLASPSIPALQPREGCGLGKASQSPSLPTSQSPQATQMGETQ